MGPVTMMVGVIVASSGDWVCVIAGRHTSVGLHEPLHGPRVVVLRPAAGNVNAGCGKCSGRTSFTVHDMPVSPGSSHMAIPCVGASSLRHSRHSGGSHRSSLPRLTRSSDSVRMEETAAVRWWSSSSSR